MRLFFLFLALLPVLAASRHAVFDDVPKDKEDTEKHWVLIQCDKSQWPSARNNYNEPGVRHIVIPDGTHYLIQRGLCRSI